jgi:hypothetical protein
VLLTYFYSTKKELIIKKLFTLSNLTKEKIEMKIHPKKSKISTILIVYVLPFILLLIFVIGYRIFSYDLAFAGVFATIFAVYLGLIIALYKSIFKALFWLIILLVFIITLPRIYPPPVPFPTETDKNIFSLGIGMGTSMDQLISCRKGELLSLSQSFKSAEIGLLKLIKYPNSEQFVEAYSKIFNRAESKRLEIQTSELWRGEFIREIGSLNKPFEKFLVDRYGEKGIAEFKLGLNVVTIHRTLLFIRPVSLAQLALYKKKEIGREIESILKPYLDFFRSLRYDDDFFPNNLRTLIRDIAIIDVRDFSQHERLIVLLMQIASIFETYLSKTLKINEPLDSQLLIKQAQIEMRDENLVQAISILKDNSLKRIPDTHFLLAETYLKKIERKSVDFLESYNEFINARKETNLFLLLSDLSHEWRAKTDELHRRMESFQSHNNIKITVDELESLRKCEGFLSRREYSLMDKEAHKVVDSTLIRIASDYYYHVVAWCYSYIHVKIEHPDGIVETSFFDRICQGLENYIALAPNGQYYNSAKELLKVICHDSSGIRRYQTTLSESEYSQRIRTELQINENLKIFNFGISGT